MKPLLLPDDVIQNGRRDHKNYRGTLDVKTIKFEIINRMRQLD